MTARAQTRLTSAVALTIASLAWFCPMASAQTTAPKTVLTVHWSSEDFPTTPVLDEALRKVLLSSPDTPVDYFAEYLESDRFPEDEAELALRAYIRQKYQGRRIDLVVAVTDIALAFVLRYREELFPDAPVVYSGFAAPDPQSIGTAQLAGVIHRQSYEETMELALSLHPSTKQVFVVADGPTTAYLDTVQRALRAFVPRVGLTYLSGMPVPRLLAAVKAVPAQSLILFVRYSQEDPGRVLFPDDVARMVAEASPVPVYAISDSVLGTGVVGGAMFSSRERGTRLGQLAQEILHGKRPNTLVERARSVPIFDWRQVQRWRISPSRLPPQSEIRFREPSAWDRYRWYIVGAIALAALQTMMIAALFVERSRRRRGQERYAMATAAGGVGVWEWNLETNEITVDPGLKSTLGYADNEIADHFDQLSQLIHPDDAPAVLARVRESAEKPYPTSEVEFRMVHRDGSIRWCLSRASYVRRNGGPAYLAGTYIDITDRKASERKLGEMQAELTRVSRLTALGEFAAALSHEIRQPLASIIANAKASLRLLGSPTPDLTEIREALLDVADAGNWANEVIQRNRQLFKQHTVQKEPLDIHDVIREVAVLAETQLQNRRIVLTTSASALPAVIGDRIELQQVLLNLIVNGIDATESVDPGPRRIVVSTTLVPEGLVKVSVSDNGVGFDGVDMQQMFSLSYTTKANGSGIGLSLSRSIIEAHGGTLWAEPNQDAGATFSFTVPVYVPAVEEAAIATARSQ